MKGARRLGYVGHWMSFTFSNSVRYGVSYDNLLLGEFRIRSVRSLSQVVIK